jgi:uroporphyrinogen decarboxylase
MAKTSTTRRQFLQTSAGTLAWLTTHSLRSVGAQGLTPRQRVDRAIAGQDLDRPPISLWHHFGLEPKGADAHAQATLAFHRDYQTDLVKVMSDFPYPRPAGAWHELREEASPFAPQLRALDAIARGLDGRAHFVETLFNPWNVVEKLSSPADVQRLRSEHPQRLLDALEVIARSEANHARDARSRGASGIFLAIANAQDGILTREEYARFSEPFDRLVLDAVKAAPLNILHVHGDDAYVDMFLKGWPAAVNYSSHGTGQSLASVRSQYDGLLIGGLDERRYRTATVAALREEAGKARAAAGARFILTPECSVPDEATPGELKKLAAVVAEG